MKNFLIVCIIFLLSGCAIFEAVRRDESNSEADREDNDDFRKIEQIEQEDNFNKAGTRAGEYYREIEIIFPYIPLSLVRGDTIFFLPTEYLSAGGVDTSSGFNRVYNWKLPDGTSGKKEIRELIPFKAFIKYRYLPQKN